MAYISVQPCNLSDLHRRYFEDRDPEIREQLLTRYGGLARSLAGRNAKRVDDLDDLVQVALVGVLSALERFDPYRGVEFSTFAWATVQGELKRHHRDHGWAVRVPRRVQEAYLRTASAVEELNQQLGRQPTLPEITEMTGDDPETVIEAMEVGSARRAVSTDARRPDDSAGAGAFGGEDDGFAAVDERGLLAALLSRLQESEREMLELRFLDEWTQAQIAERIGCSQMQVSRMLARALARLREWVEIENRAVPRTSRPRVAPIEL